MVTVDKAVFARLNKKGKEFEILVDPDTAQKAREDLKRGKDVDLSDVLAVEDIFSDSKKGIRVGKKDLEPAFGTSDILEVAKIIIKEGRINPTVEQIHKQHQEKLDKITSLISMNAIDAKTKLPIPKKTVEDALKKALYRLDERKVEDQLPDAIKAIKSIIPLTFASKKIQLNNIPPNIVTPCLRLCQNLGAIEKQNWNADKSLTLVISIPVGLKEEFIDRINAVTHGNVEMKLLE